MSSVDEDKMLTKFTDWLKSRNGGSKDNRQAQKHKRTIQAILRFNNSKINFSNLFNRKFMNAWLSEGEKAVDENSERKTKNGTLKTYLGSVQHFLRFLFVTQQEGFDPKKINLFEPVIKAWKRDLWKGIKKRSRAKNMEDLGKFPIKNDIRRLDKSLLKEEAVK